MKRFQALAALTVVFAINFIGIKPMAIVQKAMVAIRIIALLAFIVAGLPHVHCDVFNRAETSPRGLGGFLMTTGLLFSATGGSQVIAELGGEMKNPTRDIPLVMIISPLGVGVLYAFMAIVAVGVLPLSAIVNQPLTKAAHAIFSEPMYLFFAIGGGLFAIGTTLVALFRWITKSFLAASEDGVLPRRLADVNRRFGTPRRSAGPVALMYCSVPWLTNHVEPPAMLARKPRVSACWTAEFCPSQTLRSYGVSSSRSDT